MNKERKKIINYERKKGMLPLFRPENGTLLLPGKKRNVAGM
jgi:hypothetical protein